MVPQHTPGQLVNCMKHFTIAAGTKVHKRLDRKVNLIMPGAAAQDISRKPKVAVAANREHKTQAPGQSIRADSQL
jgi:hypothetical protein